MRNKPRCSGIELCLRKYIGIIAHFGILSYRKLYAKGNYCWEDIMRILLNEPKGKNYKELIQFAFDKCDIFLFIKQPEQFMMLKDGDKRSDVYSLGRIINFILTKDPNNYHHFLRSTSEKATSHNAVFRFADASELLKSVESSIQFHENVLNRQERIDKARNGVLDEDIENFIYEMKGDELCSEIIVSKGFRSSILKFMTTDDERAIYILGVIEDNFRDICLTWESYDHFANISYDIIVDNFPFQIKELAAIILSHIAYSVNRFNAQRLIDNLKDRGIEPLIEEILS